MLIILISKIYTSPEQSLARSEKAALVFCSSRNTDRPHRSPHLSGWALVTPLLTFTYSEHRLLHIYVELSRKRISDEPLPSDLCFRCFSALIVYICDPTYSCSLCRFWVPVCFCVLRSLVCHLLLFLLLQCKLWCNICRLLLCVSFAVQRKAQNVSHNGHLIKLW